MNKTKVIVGMGIALSLFTAANAMAGVMDFGKCAPDTKCGIFRYANEMSSAVTITTSTDSSPNCDVHSQQKGSRDDRGWNYPDKSDCRGTKVISILVAPKANSLVGSNKAIQGDSVSCTGAGLNTAFEPGPSGMPPYFTAIIKEISGKMTCTVVADSVESK
jgi:hypothetical protein